MEEDRYLVLDRRCGFHSILWDGAQPRPGNGSPNSFYRVLLKGENWRLHYFVTILFNLSRQQVKEPSNICPPAPTNTNDDGICPFLKIPFQLIYLFRWKTPSGEFPLLFSTIFWVDLAVQTKFLQNFLTENLVKTTQNLFFPTRDGRG